jgi:NADH:ubiquinone oxidoreductase subunit 5 (subunit L)/multisubunit Na+/H+ antiporter MnhA subunit
MRLIMGPMRFRIRTIMIAIAAVAVLVTIGRYLLNQPGFAEFLAILGLFAAAALILVATQVLLIGLLVYLTPYLLRPLQS